MKKENRRVNSGGEWGTRGKKRPGGVEKSGVVTPGEKKLQKTGGWRPHKTLHWETGKCDPRDITEKRETTWRRERKIWEKPGRETRGRQNL